MSPKHQLDSVLTLQKTPWKIAKLCKTPRPCSTLQHMPRGAASAMLLQTWSVFWSISCRSSSGSCHCQWRGDQSGWKWGQELVEMRRRTNTYKIVSLNIPELILFLSQHPSSSINLVAETSSWGNGIHAFRGIQHVLVVKLLHNALEPVKSQNCKKKLKPLPVNLSLWLLI